MADFWQDVFEDQVPEYVERMIKVQDVELTGNVRKAVSIALKIAGEREALREFEGNGRPFGVWVKDWAQERDRDNTLKVFGYEVRDKIWLLLEPILIAAGVLAMAAGLFSSFPDFWNNVQKLLLYASRLAFIGPAFAASGSVRGLSVPIVPVLVYLTYVLFSFGYVYSIIKAFNGKAHRDRANAMEIVKGLTAFFIGAISGKAV